MKTTESTKLRIQVIYLKLDENIFYLLDAGENKWIFTNKTEAITQMKAVVKDGNSDAIKLLSINAEDDNWVIQQYPWKEIAFELIKEQG